MQYRNLMSVSLLVLAALALPPHAKADDSGGFSLVYKTFFGSDDDEKELKNCSNIGGHEASPLGRVNGFFCRMEKELGISQRPTAAAPVSVTKVFDSDRRIHVEIVGQEGAGQQVATGYDSNGSLNPATGYDYLAKAWFCKPSASVTCANPADFNLGIAIAFSRSADGLVNKGYMLQDPGAVNLSNQGASQLVYNVGDGAARKTIVVKHLESNGDRYNVTSYRDASGILSAAMVWVPGGGGSNDRFSAKVNLTTQVASASFESPAVSLTATTPGVATCYSRADDGAGDFKYSPAAISCPAVDPYGDTVNGVSAYTVNAILGVSGSNWTNGLTAAIHPGAI